MDPTSAPVGGGASLSFHLLLWFSCCWCVVWCIVTVALLTFKGRVLQFPPAALPVEITAAVLVLLVDVAAVSLGVRGNLMEEVRTTCLAIALLLVAAVGAVYYMWLQTYVMRLDLALSAALLGCNALAVVSGVFTVQAVMRAERAPRQKFAPPPPSLPTILRGDMKQVE
ncbi:transmembrane protein 216 [Trypanosoma grayi]|uniref:transmembrane protein 216 n=1 Tax=Trypanosoma grayi TaxID=71804 RepID=UPI0004F408B2|nr:transmembrane protein 216 [Trypanosoma grayi]KEG11847.1 transmembrane protein 216 [Trypanosoma grayi]